VHELGASPAVAISADLASDHPDLPDGVDAFSPRPVFIALDGEGRRTDDDSPPTPGRGTTRLPSRTLVELIGQANLQAIQDAFATAFDIPTVVLDHDGYNVSEITHRVAFCEDLTRPSRAGGRCLSCDRSGMATSAATYRPTIFHCWNDLWDCTVPIVSSRGELFGYFLSGQVFFEQQADLDRYRGTADAHEIDPDSYVAAAQAVRVMPREIYVRGIECIAVLARMIADQASAALQHRELLDTLLASDAQTRRLVGEFDTITTAAAQLGAASGEGLSAVAQLCDSIERVIDCDSVVIFRIDEGRTLRPVVVRDPYPDAISQWSVAVGRGIVGTVAATGEAMQVDEVASHPLFEAIPGVPVEAEALVALPLEHAGEVVGVLQVSRLDRRTFSPHEHDVLRMLALNMAVALGTSSLRAETLRYRRADAAQRALVGQAAAGVSFSGLCEQLLAHVDGLLAPTRAAIHLELGPEESVRATLHADDDMITAAERGHADIIQRARDRGHAIPVIEADGTLLISGIGGSEWPSGILLMWREDPFSAVERDVAESLAQHGAIALRDLWQQRQARALHAQTTRFAELSQAVARASSRAEIAGALVHAHELLSTGATTTVVLRGLAPGVLDLWQRHEGELRLRQLVIAGRPALRFPAAAVSDRESELFDAWGRAVIAEARAGGANSQATVGLRSADHPWGGLVIESGRPPDRAERAVLQVLAHAAVAVLEELQPTTTRQTGVAPREMRLAALHEVSQRLLAGATPKEVGDRICAELGDLMGADGVVLTVWRRSSGKPVAVANTSLTSAPRGQLQALARRWADCESLVADDGAVGIPFDLPDDTRAVLIAVGCRHDVDPVILGTFAGYCALALGSAREAAQTRRAALDAERAANEAQAREEQLRALVGAHAELLAASTAGDLDRVVSMLSTLADGDVAIYDRDGRRLAATADQPAVMPELGDACRAGPIHAVPAGYAVAITDRGEPLGWLVSTLLDSTPDQQVLALAAATVAVALLSGRASAEADARMRSDYVEALLGSERPTESLVRHGRALGHDATLPARVAVARADELSGAELHQLAVRWAQNRSDILIAQRAEELVLIGPAEGAWPDEVRELVSASAPSVRIGVGVSTETNDYLHSYLGGSRAVAALRHLGRSGLISIDGEGLEQLLLRAAEPELLSAFVRRVLAPLDRYDRDHTAELRHTVELCVKNGWNLQASARSAHVHHSTLRYRLHRITTLTGLDLHHPDDRLAIQLALMADRLLQG
jgi:ligand-binding sensor protein/putative methionine-R-sulfoxide reductase with GAF domain